MLKTEDYDIKMWEKWVYVPRRIHYSNRRSPQADKEKRGNKVIKAFRVLDPENSSELSGAIQDLERDNTLPPLRDIPGSHIAYILDPHTVRKEFNSGFRTGFSFANAKQRIENQNENLPTDGQVKETSIAKVGKISILDNHKIIAAYIESPTLVQERKAIYEILGDEGLRGFEKREYRKVGAPLIVLATLQTAVHDKDDREKLEEAVDTSILIHQAAELDFGPLQVV